MSRRSRAVLVYLLLSLLEGLVAIAALLRIPADSQRGWLLGFSLSRLTLLMGMFLGVLCLAGLLWKLWRDALWMERWLCRLSGLVRSGAALTLVAVFCLSAGMLCLQVYYLSQGITDPSVRAYLERLAPLLLWVGAIFLQMLALLIWLRHDLRQDGDDWGGRSRLEGRTVIKVSAIIAGIFLTGWGFVATTGLGITPDAVGWDEPGVPILPLQAYLAWLIGALYLICFSEPEKSRLSLQGRRKPLTWVARLRQGLGWRLSRDCWVCDLVIAFLLWLLAAWLWSAQPMLPSYFAPRPGPPNYEYYPYSDASTYDLSAQRLLIGEGYGGVGIKPLYVLFLAAAHQLRGQGYEEVISLQVLLLALFPVFIYFLAFTLHRRVSGIIAALLIILREANALNLAGIIRVSNAKLMMTDLPTACGLALLTWLMVVWWKKYPPIASYRKNSAFLEQLSANLPLLAGGICGLVILLRPQAAIIVPLLLVFLLVILVFSPCPERWRIGLRDGSLLLLGLVLSLSPWLWRGWQMTGKIVLNDPGQTTFLTEQYHPNPGAERLAPLPGESAGEFEVRVRAALVQYIHDYPQVVLNFISAHFLHNQIEALLALPSSFWLVYDLDTYLFPQWRGQAAKLWEACCSPKAYVTAVPFWRQASSGVSIQTFPAQVILPLLINLLLVSLGIGVGLQRWRLAALAPLGINVVYSLGTALGRVSGWRFILAVDWVVILYYAIGLGWLSLWALNLDGKQVETGWDEVTGGLESGHSDGKARKALPTWFSTVALALLIFGVGLSLLLVERLIPSRYIADQEANLLALSRLEGVIPHLKGAVTLRGRALYPRFYRAGEGGSQSGWSAYAPRDYNRLGFYLLGPVETQVVLALEDSPGSAETPPFPNAVDVLVVGCAENNYLDALAVVILNNQGGILVRTSERYRAKLFPSELSCPLPAP